MNDMITSLVGKGKSDALEFTPSLGLKIKSGSNIQGSELRRLK